MVRLLLLCVLLSTAASAQTIYRWTDSRGVVHYTDDPAAIPAGVKATTTEGVELSHINVHKDPTRDESAREQPAAEPAASAVKARADEDWWRSQFRALKQKVRELEDDVAIEQPSSTDSDVTRLGGSYVCPPGYYGAMYPYGHRRNSFMTQGLSLGGSVTSPVGGGGSLTVKGGFQSTAQLPATPQGWAAAYGPCYWLPDAAYERSRERVEKSKAALARAREELADLERRAANEAVPLEWRR